jgi:hypothetical protein
MVCKPLNLKAPSASYTSFDLTPPRTPGRRSFPSVQVITRPLSIVLFTLVKQCTNPLEVLCLMDPQLDNLTLLRKGYVGHIPGAPRFGHFADHIV